MPVNTDILSALEERKRKFGAVIERVGDIFLDRINLFKLYAIYCSNQRAVTVRIQELKGEVPDFKAFCAVAHKKAFCRGMCLPDFLIAPLQRLCKYPLIFENLLEHTPATHPDHEKLSEAHAAIKEIVTKVNERTRQVENVEKLTELEKEYHLSEAGIDIVQVERELVKKGTAKYSKKGKVPATCEVILFNDCVLLLVDKKGASHVYLNAPLGDILLSNTDTEDLEFDVIVLRQFSFKLHFETTKEKKSWLTAIRKYRQQITELPVGEEEVTRVRHNTFAGWLSPRSAGKVTKLEETTAQERPFQPKVQPSGQQTHISPVLEGKPVLFERQSEKEEPEDAEKKLKLQRMTQVQLAVQKLGTDKEKISMLRYLLEREIETTCEMRTMLLQTVAKQKRPEALAKHSECRKCASVGRERKKDLDDGWVPRRSQSSAVVASLSRKSVSPSRRKKKEDKASRKAEDERKGKKQKTAGEEEAKKEKKEEKEKEKEEKEEKEEKGEKEDKKKGEKKGGKKEAKETEPTNAEEITITVDEPEKHKERERESREKEAEATAEAEKKKREREEEREKELEEREKELEESKAEVESLGKKLERALMEADVAKIEVEKMRSGGKEREKNTELLSKTMEIVKDNEELVRQRNELEELVLGVKAVVENSADMERGFLLVKERLAAFQPSSKEMPSNHVLNRVRFFEMLNKEIAAQKNSYRGSPKSNAARRKRQPPSSSSLSRSSSSTSSSRMASVSSSASESVARSSSSRSPHHRKP